MQPGVALLLMFAPLATAVAQSSVWRITRDDGTAFLGAKCHLLRPADFPLPAEFEAAYAAGQMLVLEADLARLQSPQAQNEIVGLGQQAPGGSLQRDLAPAVWQAVERYSARAKIPLGTINRLRPWFFSFMVTEVELQRLGLSNTGVDRHFHARALAEQKPIAALETYEQQLQLMVHFGDGVENEIVLHSINEAAEFPQTIDAVVAAWRTGDLAAMDTLLNARLRQNLPAVFDLLVVQRSRAWRPQIAALLRTEPVEFILVDGAHLPGPDGLIAGLQADGCAVEPLHIAP